MKKNVLMITQNFSPEIGSAANRMKGVSENLSDNFNVTIWTTNPQYPQKEIYKESDFQQEELRNAKVKRVQTKNKRFEKIFFFRFLLYLEVLWKLLRFVWKDDGHYDMIFVSTPPLSIPLIGLVAKRKYKAELIVDVRDLWPETLKAIKGLFTRIVRYLAYPVERLIYLRADKIIVNSEGFIDYIKRIVGEDKEVYFVPNSLTKNELAQERQEPADDAITIIYAGNLGVAQDLTTFLSLARTFKDNTKIHFLIIGYGIHYEEVHQEIMQRELFNVVLKPPEPRDKVFQRLLKADIAYMGLDRHPVFQTVIPGKVIDYMGAGLPIIGVTSGYSKHIIEEAEAGIVLENEADFDMLESVVNRWIDSPKLRHQYGQNGKNFAIEHFNWENNRKQLERIVAQTDEKTSDDVCLERISK
ncbi:glycosyltransferase family 4 protein [Listeria booriae]|uniref:Glycosyltransferase family 4 protein n=1 Tax=Listeria booriae TaxID=1552123 RepID=A0A842CK45_9LIST|nr:glycosyltransferase family 4 protein [Listeria booriae]MBC2002165.1 glycosyltransferase family 4 protein [Listeria booriae]